MSALDIFVVALALALYRPLNGFSRSSRGVVLARAVQALLIAVDIAGVAWLHRHPWSPLLAMPSRFLLVVLTWRIVTRDYDVTVPIPPQRWARLQLVGTAAVSWVLPSALLHWQWVGLERLGAWQHHMHMPVRVLRASVSWYFAALLSVAVLEAVDSTEMVSPASFVVLVACVVFSHYLRAGLDKMALGRRPWDWCLRNSTHLIAASAHHWGWLRFTRTPVALLMVPKLRPFRAFLNTMTVSLETACLLSLLDVRLLWVFCVAIVVLHAGIFALSGILFWEYAVTVLALAVWVAGLPAAVLKDALGWQPFVLALGIVALPLAFQVPWRPYRLAWWDSPLTERVRWEAVGESGARYGLYNDFMCPYEREYGRSEGLYLIKTPLLTGHPGLVYDLELRDALVSSRGDRSALNRIRHAWGRVRYDETAGRAHERFLVAMFRALNAGATKFVVPKRVWWLKAPGGQVVYWGDLPKYHLQEPVHFVDIFYSEQYYDEPSGRASTTDHLLLRVQVIA
jgi:hypothetical protein